MWIYSLLVLSSSIIKSVKKEISLGVSFTLECDRKAFSQVRWYKNDDLVYPNQSARISINSKWRKSLMKVENAINSDTGVYKCYGFKNGKEMGEIIAYNISSASSKCCVISSVLRQNRESQNECFKKTNGAKFSEKRTFFTP